jgi:hypothetical protein
VPTFVCHEVRNCCWNTSLYLKSELYQLSFNTPVSRLGPTILLQNEEFSVMSYFWRFSLSFICIKSRRREAGVQASADHFGDQGNILRSHTQLRGTRSEYKILAEKHQAGRIILKWTREKCILKMWIGLNWRRARWTFGNVGFRSNREYLERLNNYEMFEECALPWRYMYFLLSV